MSGEITVILLVLVDTGKLDSWWIRYDIYIYIFMVTLALV